MEFEVTALEKERSAAVAGVVVFTINGVSKLFAYPDLKLSWVVASGREASVRRAIGELELANDMYLSCSTLSQQLLPTLLRPGTRSAANCAPSWMHGA